MRRLIGEMPAEGKASYELQYGAQARKMLAEAIAAGDADALAAISRQFFHTKAGYEATYLLGTSEMELGRPLAAALCLRRLQESAQAAAPFEPTLSLKLAACWLRAAMPSQAAAVLVQLKGAAPNAEFHVAGKTRKLFSNDSQALAGSARPPAIRGSRKPTSGRINGPCTAAAPDRNTASPGGSPLLNRRWAVPSANDPQIEKQLSEMQQEHLEQGGRLTPGLHPLAVKDYVFTRSVTGLAAIDFHTGKRIRIPSLEKDTHLENMLSQSGSAAQVRGPSPFSQWLEQRVWDDATYGTLSSDGDRVYCVEDLEGNMQEATPGAVRAIDDRQQRADRDSQHDFLQPAGGIRNRHRRQVELEFGRRAEGRRIAARRDVLSRAAAAPGRPAVRIGRAQGRNSAVGSKPRPATCSGRSKSPWSSGAFSSADEIEHFAHGGTSAHHVVFDLDFSAQRLVFLPQLFPVTHVVKGQAGDAGHVGHDLQVSFVELYSWARGIQR